MQKVSLHLKFLLSHTLIVKIEQSSLDILGGYEEFLTIKIWSLILDHHYEAYFHVIRINTFVLANFSRELAFLGLEPHAVFRVSSPSPSPYDCVLIFIEISLLIDQLYPNYQGPLCTQPAYSISLAIWKFKFALIFHVYYILLGLINHFIRNALKKKDFHGMT